MKIQVGFVTGLLLLVFAFPTQAQSPRLLNYQGVLNQNGTPANGTFIIRFAIYSAPTGGTPLYSETQTVNVSDGVFNVLVGSVNPLPETLFTSGGDRYLGIKVGNDSEMTPRFRLSSVAYAFSAAHAAVADSVRSGTGDGHSLDAADGDPKDVVFVDNAGNVGVGTLNPNAKLDVLATGSNTALAASTSGTGNAGVFTISNPQNNVAALAAITNGSNVAILGRNTGAGETGNAGFFEIQNQSNPAPAVEGITNGRGNAGLFTITNPQSNVAALAALTEGLATAVFALNSGADFNSTAGFFQVQNANSPAAAVVGLTDGVGNAAFFRTLNATSPVSALFAQHDNPNGSAAFFEGNITVTKNIFKGGGGFRIDHPLDPANKYLNHSFVESPDMMNIYNGNVVLDANGEAVVELPAWFEALNRDFRYQLTAIGDPAPNLYVAEEISGNRFRIAGGQAGMKVSWQVTGIRKDAHANAYRIPVEEDKAPAERGRYLEPELYGQPAARAIGRIYAPSMDRLPDKTMNYVSRRRPESN